MKMIFISNNNYIQKFLFNNLGNMGKQEVIDFFKCLPYLTSVIYKTISSIIDNNYFQIKRISFYQHNKKKF